MLLLEVRGADAIEPAREVTRMVSARARPVLLRAELGLADPAGPRGGDAAAESAGGLGRVRRRRRGSGCVWLASGLQRLPWISSLVAWISGTLGHSFSLLHTMVVDGNTLSADNIWLGNFPRNISGKQTLNCKEGILTINCKEGILSIAVWQPMYLTNKNTGILKPVS